MCEGAEGRSRSACSWRERVMTVENQFARSEITKYLKHWKRSNLSRWDALMQVVVVHCGTLKHGKKVP